MILFVFTLQFLVWVSIVLSSWLKLELFLTFINPNVFYSYY